jgi:hypothetical protein
MRQNSSILRKGHYFELLDEVNCIPPGIYKFTGREGHFLMFKVGADVIFGISIDCEPLLMPVTRSTARRYKICRDDFLVLYSGLYQRNTGKPYCPYKPLSFCALTPVSEELFAGMMAAYGKVEGLVH